MNELKNNEFLCQKCHRKIKLEGESLEKSVIDALKTTESLPPHLNDAYKEQEEKAIDLLAKSFVVVANESSSNIEPALKSSTNWNSKVDALINIFEVASNKCQYDHPLCTCCTEAILIKLKDQFAELVRDRDSYQKYLIELSETKAQVPEPKEIEDDSLVEHLEQKLNNIKDQRLTLTNELKQLDDESKKLDEYEAKFWAGYQDFQVHLDEVTKDRNAVEQQIKVLTERFARMKRTNVYDDAFCISYDGHFGTINDFRLGRLPAQAIDWPEMNAGLGQVVLLLWTLAKKMDFRFKEYVLYPMGSFSKVGKSGAEKHHLYISNEMSISRVVRYRKFDKGLIMLLSCIKELSDYALKTDSRFKQKYEIKGDTIGGASIKSQFTSDAIWTKAMKNMLTNLKYLLAWCSTRMS